MQREVLAQLEGIRGDTALVVESCEIQLENINKFLRVLSTLSKLAVIQSTVHRGSDRTMDSIIMLALKRNKMKALFIETKQNQTFKNTMRNLNAGLEYLTFKTSDPDQDVFNSIGTFLTRGDCVLTYLNISDCFLKDPQIEPIGRALAANSSLTELRIRKSSFASIGLEHIATGLRNNSTLKILDLSYLVSLLSGPTEAAYTQLFRSVVGSGLTSLYLVNNFGVSVSQFETELRNYMSDYDLRKTIGKQQTQQALERALKAAISNSKLSLLDLRGVAGITFISDLQDAVNKNRHNIRVIITEKETSTVEGTLPKRRKRQPRMQKIRKLSTKTRPRPYSYKHGFIHKTLTPQMTEVIELSDSSEPVVPFSPAAGGGLVDLTGDTSSDESSFSFRSIEFS